MTIQQNIAYIMEHPFFEEAMRDRQAMEKLLFEVHYHVYDTVSTNAARVYRHAKRMNSPQVVEALRDMPPPVNLDIRLPIPEVVECRVVLMENPAEPLWIAGS